ncbi:MAG: hypothetical protein Edafosvirus4_44 [Edafosvirus sp.]|uniref:Uncharacterized protein n=1 Tax=Edafosvirus sp. TaxID=2487765 RepID=A0A3G4ZT32_9VIRU|nr:MAG: hypothetical protein Edafosvirus4_44 [Edafosvirus sp.]
MPLNLIIKWPAVILLVAPRESLQYRDVEVIVAKVQYQYIIDI